MKKQLRENRVFKVILFISIFLILMDILNQVAVISNKNSREAWERYTKKNSINTLFVGSSVGNIVDVGVIDSVLKTNSINMCTPDQLYKTSYDAISLITRQHPIDRVVIVTGLDSVKNNENYVADHLFREAMYSNAPFADRIYYKISDRLMRYLDWEFLGSTDSLNVWFDWTNYSEKALDALIKNVQVTDEPDQIKGTHYRINMENMPYKREKETVSEEVSLELEKDLEKLKSRDIKCFEIDNEAFETLDCTLRFLKINNIDALLMISPHRLDDRNNYGDDYAKLDEYLRYFTEKRGARYINLDTDSEVRRQLENATEPFRDVEHLTDNGIRVVAPIIANRIEGYY